MCLRTLFIVPYFHKLGDSIPTKCKLENIQKKFKYFYQWSLIMFRKCCHSLEYANCKGYIYGQEGISYLPTFLNQNKFSRHTYCLHQVDRLKSDLRFISYYSFYYLEFYDVLCNNLLVQLQAIFRQCEIYFIWSYFLNCWW